MDSFEESNDIPIGYFSRSVSAGRVDGRIPEDCWNLKLYKKTVIPVPPLTSYTPECKDKNVPSQKKQPLSNGHRRLIKQKSRRERKSNKVKSSWSMFHTFALIFSSKSASVFIAVIVFLYMVEKVGCNDPERERMHDESCRLESFQNYQGRGNHLVLAQNGFYYSETESPTTTRCYTCDLVVSDWQNSSDIPGHHRTHSPHCIVHSSTVSHEVDQREHSHRPALQGIERVEHIVERETAMQVAGGEDMSVRAHNSPSLASLLQYFRRGHSPQLYDAANNTPLLLPEPADLYDRPPSNTLSGYGVTLRPSNVSAAGVNPNNQQPTVAPQANYHLNADAAGNI